LIAADANKQRSIPGPEWNKARDPQSASRAMQEYLATLDDAAFGAPVHCAAGSEGETNFGGTVLEEAQSAVDAALLAWDESVSELWLTSSAEHD
jgi:hypothetical protein